MTSDIQAMMDRSVEPPVYPNQKDIEAKLLATLAAVINSDQADLKYDILDMVEADFHFRDHREIFAAMKALVNAGDYVDQATIRAKIGDAWTNTLTIIFDASKANHEAAGTYKRQILHWANVERLQGMGNLFLAAVNDAAADTDANLPALVANLQEAVFDLDKTDRIAPPIRSEAELTDNFLQELKTPKRGLKTGFDRLDRIIQKLTPGLFIIAAPPSAGKTTFVKQLADQVAELNDAPVLFFSFEQSADELRIKSLARLSGVNNELVKEGREDEKVGKAAVQYKRFAKWIKIIEGDRQYTAGRIRLLAQREKLKTGKAPLLIIDYLQVIPVDDPKQDRRASVDFIVSDLRRIARDIGSPVIAVSAMSRAEYKDVKMTGFKESGGIEYGADIAAILAVKEETEGTQRDVELNIIKNRNGRRAKIGMKYYMLTDRFDEQDVGFVNYMDTLGRGTHESKD